MKNKAWTKERGMLEFSGKIRKLRRFTLHRDDGLPAVEYADGSKEWWVNGKLHRDGDLPAVERADGTRIWSVDGLTHRDGGLPAVENADGTRRWFVHGKFHRPGGLPAIEAADGTKCWFIFDHEMSGVECEAEWAKGEEYLKIKYRHPPLER